MININEAVQGTTYYVIWQDWTSYKVREEDFYTIADAEGNFFGPMNRGRLLCETYGEALTKVTCSTTKFSKVPFKIIPMTYTETGEWE